MTARRWVRRHRAVVVGCALVLAFVVAMLAWVGKNPAHEAAGLPPGSGVPSAGVPSESMSTSPSSSAATSPSGKPTTVAGARGLPASALDADHSGLPAHSVKIEVTSDGYIAALGIEVAHAKQPKYEARWLKSPFSMVTVGYSNNAVAFVAAQSASNATWITCTLWVDGTVRAQRTAHGAKQFTTCLG